MSKKIDKIERSLPAHKTEKKDQNLKRKQEKSQKWFQSQSSTGSLRKLTNRQKVGDTDPETTMEKGVEADQLRRKGNEQYMKLKQLIARIQ